MATVSSLDIAERQVLLLFSADAVPWHHRILVERLDSGRWIIVTPTHDIEVADLAEAEDVKPLERASPLPESCRPVFSFEEMDALEMQGLRWQCRRYDVLGFATPSDPSPADAEWYFADTGSDQFGEGVPTPLLRGGRAVLRGASGLAQRDIDDPASFVFIQRVSKSDHEKWLTEKRSGAGRDPRLNEGDPDDSDRPRLSDSLATMRQVDKKQWLLKGPSAARGRSRSGSCRPAWSRRRTTTTTSASAASTRTALLAAELKHHFTVLWVMVSHDRLDVYNVAACEYVARRIWMIQRAIKRNARSPDFSGLESFLANLMDLSGGIITREFERYVADVQKGEAQFLKQQRLAKEEVEALDERTKSSKAAAARPTGARELGNEFAEGASGHRSRLCMDGPRARSAADRRLGDPCRLAASFRRTRP